MVQNQASVEPDMTQWTSSTLFFVSDVEAAIDFYIDRFGFTLNMRYEEEGRARVAGVSNGDGCAILLTDQWPDKNGTGVLYTALDKDEFTSLKRRLAEKRVQMEDGFWGRPLLVVTDPGGNQLYFPHPGEVEES
ncbi:VOC family protein [Niveispirillum sp. KHB5.9]|uniref:VOC family protein n=1 Tax=Niveispirillum sp. KHB5.9 TaxID=3400269 RepID=UPI003A83DFEE